MCPQRPNPTQGEENKKSIRIDYAFDGARNVMPDKKNKYLTANICEETGNYRRTGDILIGSVQH